MNFLTAVILDKMRRDADQQLKQQAYTLWPQLTRQQQLQWWSQFSQLGQQLGLKIKAR